MDPVAPPSASPPPSAGLIGFLAWFDKNKKRLLAGVAAGLVLLFVIIAIAQHQVQKEVTASEALSDVRVPYSVAAPVPAGTVESLSKVVQQHKGTKAAARALLMSASLRFAEQTPAGLDDAQKRFSQLLQEYPDSPWNAEANLGLAACLSATGKTNEAIAKYEDIRKRFANSSIIGDAKIALASLYETTKPEEAYRLYDELADQTKNPAGSAASEARARQDDLVKRVPELAKLRQPIFQPPPPTATSMPLSLTNPVAAASNTVVSNLQRMLSTNRSGPGQSIPLKVSPTAVPSPAAPSPAAPAPSTGSGRAPAPSK